MGVKERCSRSAPCVFCGDSGYDMRVHYPEKEEVVHWCHKTNASKGDIITVGGESYICSVAGKQIGIGTFDLFIKYLTKEEWIAKQERINPNWKPKGAYKKSTRMPQMSARVPVTREVFLNPEKKELVGEEKVLSRKKLDKVYRAFLDMLVLEKKHRDSLLKEWESPVHDVSSLLSDYPIRSLPPIDKARFANGEKFENPTRKYVVARLLQMFGDLRGVPGFYLRSGSYWEGKSEQERWTFIPLEGMIFPCYDEEGLLYRIRVRDDYPEYELKEGKTSSFNGKYGAFKHSYDKDGKHCWTFYEKGGNTYPVSGVKPFGKVNGKYKNFSSIAEKLQDMQAVNTMEGGSRSGSPYSVYAKYSSNFMVVFGTEGEKKGMVANAVKHFPVTTVAGVWTFRALFEPGENGKSCIDVLKEKGMKYFVLCYDADKEDNEEVRKAEAAFIAELKKHDVQPRIGYWKKSFDKGLDDILLAGVDITIGPA